MSSYFSPVKYFFTQKFCFLESTQKCFNTGASIFHLHVRNEDESPSSDVNKFKELLVGIEESCPNIIIQFSTGGGGRSQEERW